MMRLRVFLEGEDVSDEIRRTNGKSNPFGWSSSDLVHDRAIGGSTVEIKIGTLYCGEPQITEPGYQSHIEETEDTPMATRKSVDSPPTEKSEEVVTPASVPTPTAPCCAACGYPGSGECERCG